MKGVFTKKEAKKLDKKATEGTVKKASEDAGNIVTEKAKKKIQKILKEKRGHSSGVFCAALTPKSKQMLDEMIGRPQRAIPASKG